MPIFFIDGYLKFKKANQIALKVAQKSPLWNQIKQVLESRFNYYQLLPDRFKDDFIFRTFKFMKRRQWVSSSSPVIELHKKVLISASATQLTFGLKDFSFGRFKTILVHDNAYYNRHTGHYHRGEVNQAGLIVLSWKYFEEGYNNGNDKINLGLHEMAHALNLAVFLSQGRRYRLQKLLEKFQQSSLDEITRMRDTDEHFLRSYGSTNPHEFFSVAVEHFFEAPHEFKSQLPDLYIELCTLLNQDPANKVYRGFQSPHKTLYKNTIAVSGMKFSKPKIKIHPNFNLLVPIFLTTTIYAIIYGIFSSIIKLNNEFAIPSAAVVYMLSIYYVFKRKAKSLSIIDTHIVLNTMAHRGNQSVHIKNIVNVDITYMLTNYKTSINYFENDLINTTTVSLYCSPASIKKLERSLLRMGVHIKHNNKWLRKENI